MLKRAGALAMVLCCACGRAPAIESTSAGAATPAPAQDPLPATTSAPVELEMRNVRLHAAADVILDVRTLRGQMISRNPSQPPVFDDQAGFTIRVFDADVSLDAQSLANLLNHHVFAYDGAPLKDLTIDIDRGRLVQKGKMHKGVWVPFTMTATVGVAEDGRLRIHMESVNVLGVPSTKLLDLFGLKLDDVMTMKTQRGVEVRDDDVLVDIGRVVPPPELRGRLASVEIEGHSLRQRLTSTDGARAASLRAAPAGVRNFVFFSGSRIRFGKLTMTDADLRLIDADGRDPFDFFPGQYVEQLVAGYSKNTRIGGLETFMPDFEDLKKPASAASPPAAGSRPR